MDTNSKTICMLPWVSMETTPMGTSRPCCLAMDEITKPDGTKYALRENTLEEIYKSEYMVDLREQFLRGEKPKTCSRCWDEEDAGRTSKRMNTDVRFKHERPLIDFSDTNPDSLWFIDLKLGNICNLKCRICGSWSSSKWAREEIDYIRKYKNRNAKDHIAYKWLKDGKWPRESEVFWENMIDLLPNIKYFEFTGGEPFMIKEHFQLLQQAVDGGFAKDIEIHYNTNGTQYPEEFVHLWKEFKYVEIAFSIDNVGKRFEYERFGARWDEVCENIKRFRDLRDQNNNIKLQICLTVNIQNVYYLKDLCDWMRTQDFDYHHFNMLHDPRHQNIGEMTIEAKQIVTNRLKQDQFHPHDKNEIDKLIKFIDNGPSSNGKDFVRLMKQTDTYRKENFLETHTQIAKAMGYSDT